MQLKRYKIYYDLTPRRAEVAAEKRNLFEPMLVHCKAWAPISVIEVSYTELTSLGLRLVKQLLLSEIPLNKLRQRRGSVCIQRGSPDLSTQRRGEHFCQRYSSNH